MRNIYKKTRTPHSTNRAIHMAMRILYDKGVKNYYKIGGVIFFSIPTIKWLTNASTQMLCTIFSHLGLFFDYFGICPSISKHFGVQSYNKTHIQPKDLP